MALIFVLTKSSAFHIIDLSLAMFTRTFFINCCTFYIISILNGSVCLALKGLRYLSPLFMADQDSALSKYPYRLFN